MWLFFEINLNLFFSLNHDCSPGQFKPLFFQEHDFFFKNLSSATNFKKLTKGNLFSSISIVDEKNNLRKCSNLEPLGYKEDSKHCISFLFENNVRIFF
jgi:hypothetical protein